MLPHKLSSPPVRLLLTGGVLKDARRNQHTVSAIDDVVIHEPFDFADNGQKALIHKLRHFSHVGHPLVAPYRCVHRLTSPLFYPASLKWVNPFHHNQNATSQSPVQPSEKQQQQVTFEKVPACWKKSALSSGRYRLCVSAVINGGRFYRLLVGSRKLGQRQAYPSRPYCSAESSQRHSRWLANPYRGMRVIPRGTREVDRVAAYAGDG